MGRARAWVWVAIAACGEAQSGGGSEEMSASGASDPGIPCAGAEAHAGEATYYDFADGSGNCGFPATPDDLMVGAMNHVDYAASATCGSCFRVTDVLGNTLEDSGIPLLDDADALGEAQFPACE